MAARRQPDGQKSVAEQNHANGAPLDGTVPIGFSLPHSSAGVNHGSKENENTYEELKSGQCEYRGRSQIIPEVSGHSPG